MEWAIMVVTIIRLVAPLTILRWPLGGVLVSILADALDQNILRLFGIYTFDDYQKWDKALDIYYLNLTFYKSFTSSPKNPFTSLTFFKRYCA